MAVSRICEEKSFMVVDVYRDIAPEDVPCPHVRAIFEISGQW